jgi:N-acetylglutamate synthase-like GNAT family acetyltransferase
MEEKGTPKVTGVSDIRGKTVRIRHATEADMAFIEEQLEKNNMDTEDLNAGEFVVATEDGEITGFGRMRKTGQFYQVGCVVVVEERRSRGIGSLIVKHLMDLSPVTLAYIPAELEGYFTKLGFVKMQEGSKELLDALDEACKVKGRPNTAIMVYEKSKP